MGSQKAHLQYAEDLDNACQMFAVVYRVAADACLSQVMMDAFDVGEKFFEGFDPRKLRDHWLIILRDTTTWQLRDTCQKMSLNRISFRGLPTELTPGTVPVRKNKLLEEWPRFSQRKTCKLAAK